MLRTNPQTESAVISNSSFFNRQKEAVSFSINSDSSIQAATSSIPGSYTRGKEDRDSEGSDDDQAGGGDGAAVIGSTTVQMGRATIKPIPPT